LSVVDRPDAADGIPDVRALRRCISEVAALSALSAVWAGASRATVADGLTQVLQQTFQADVAFVALRGTPDTPALESLCLAAESHAPIAQQIRASVTAWLAREPPTSDLPAVDAGSIPLLIAPIGIHAEHGVIVLASPHAGFPPASDRLLLNIAGNQATHALLADRVREEQKIADTLQGIGIAVAAELDPERVVQRVTDEATALTGANFGAFFYNVTNAAGESYMLYTLSGAPREAFARFAMPRNTAIFGPTFAGAGVVRLPDVTRDPRFGHNPPYYGMPAGHLPVRSYLAVPVVSRTGKVHGGLFLGHKEIGVFTERHERLAVGLAAWAALAMDNGYLYAEAQRANSAKDQFLATLSHELRTPLNALVGWMSMLRRPEVMSASGTPRAWAAIDRNTEALTDLVEDLLDVSRIATGKVRLADGEVDLNDVVRDSARLIEPRYLEKQVTLSADLPPAPCHLRGDVARLRQVVSNLLSNAVKFTASGGRVTAAVRCEGASIVLTVTDTGIGIHPDFLPHVFERFQQAESQGTLGLGLGLAIVKNLIELHGGTVAASSGGVGQGAQFTITLPHTPRAAS
jgi:signal transduction histidine kinase